MNDVHPERVCHFPLAPGVFSLKLVSCGGGEGDFPKGWWTGATGRVAGVDGGLEEGVSSSRSTVRAGQASREGSSGSQLTALGTRLGVWGPSKVGE